MGSRKYQVCHWQGFYNFEKCQLVSEDKAKKLRYYPMENLISTTDFVYEKIE